MSCKHGISAQNLSGARSIIAQGCCPPDDTQPPPIGEQGPPGTTITPGGDIPGDETPPQPQPDPQPDPPARIYRKRANQRRSQRQRYPTPSNRWRWKASVIDGTPPTGPGPQSTGGTISPGQTPGDPRFPDTIEPD